MKQIRLFFVTFSGILFLAQAATCQSYFVAGFTGGFPKYDALDGIVKRYNSLGEHRLDNFGFMPGFEFGIGSYGERTMMEAKIASLGQTINSHLT
ncbi:MAG: hypothetical protein RI894_1960, partial [Bacteroidota bacterium]